MTEKNLTKLLDLTCHRTGETIRHGETVRLHNHHKQTIAYGKLVWDTHCRKFNFVNNKGLNKHYKCAGNDFDNCSLFDKPISKLKKAELTADLTYGSYPY